MRLADYVMRFVAQQGVKHVFLLPFARLRQFDYSSRDFGMA